MENPPQSDGSQTPGAPAQQQRKFLGLLGLILLVTTLFLLSSRGPTQEVITYDFFLKQLDEKNILQLRINDAVAEGRFQQRPEAPVKINDDGTLEAPTDSEGKRKKVAEHFRVVLPTDSASRGQLSQLLSQHPEVQRAYNAARQRADAVLHACAGPAVRAAAACCGCPTAGGTR